ncbi:hypothetical protein GCM10023238_07000 [Streptomyces heliomycini]
MFLTISTTGSPQRPATDLGFLLHSIPRRRRRFSTSYGTAHVLYPEADAERCTAALLLEVDAVALVRRGKGKGRGAAPDAALAQYVNDRPYAASSLLAVALSGVFSARCAVCAPPPGTPGAAEPPACRGARAARPRRPPDSSAGSSTARLDGHRRARGPGRRVPRWGDSRYVRLVLEAETLTLAEALRHLYVCSPSSTTPSTTGLPRRGRQAAARR